MTEHVTVCDQAYDPSTTPKYDLHSVSSLTTYQLRQELVRLGAFERFFPPEKVQYCCYDSLLEAHITLLREAKAEEEAAQFARHNAEVEARKAQLAEAKAARKREAEERSRKRREAQKAALHADHGDAAPADATPTPEVKTADSLPSLILRSKPVVEVVSSTTGE
jgi:sRNA-binding protein